MPVASSYLSEVDVKLSQINVLFSEINQLMSPSQVPTYQSRLLLPRVDIILSEIMSFVSYSKDRGSDIEESHDDQDMSDDVLDALVFLRQEIVEKNPNAVQLP